MRMEETGMKNDDGLKRFLSEFGLHQTGASIFTRRLKNPQAQMTGEESERYETSFCYYNIYEEVSWLKTNLGDGYAGTYRSLDHATRVYSPSEKCFLMAAQPYEFHEHRKRIEATWEYFGLSFMVLDDYSWHFPGRATLYVIGEADKLKKIFGRIPDFIGEVM